MSLLLTSVLIAIGANLDNLGVGIAYGIRKINISHTANAIIAAMSFTAALLSAILGKTLRDYVSPEISLHVGAMLLCLVGTWIFIQPIISAVTRTNAQVIGKKGKPRHYIGPTEILNYPERADIDNSRDVGCWEAVILGVALSINAFAGGLDAGTVGISTWSEAALVGVFSFITIITGCYLGEKYAAEQLGQYANIISGTILLLVGLHQLLS